MEIHPTVRRGLTRAALVLAAALATGCASAPAPPRLPGAASQLTTTGREFVLQAAVDGVYEVQAAQLALGRAVDPRVKSLADMLVTQHLQANGELDVLMQAKGMTVPPNLPPDKLAKLQQLAALPAGPAFDIEFVRMVGVQDHLADIALFERASADAVDPDLRRWIGGTLPMLHAHLSAAQALAGAATR
jgi:putative membrane protein